MLNVSTAFSPDFTIQNTNKIVRSNRLMNIVKQYHNQVGNLRAKFYKKPFGIIKFIIGNNTRQLKRKPIPMHLRMKLNNELKSNIEKLEMIINRDLSHWKLLDS